MKRTATATAVALAACGLATPAALASGTSDVHTALASARQATQRYHEVNAALQAGYVPR
jgi:hypothetical protein